MTQKDSGWWTDFFDPFRPAFDLISRKVTNAHVNYFIKKLNLKPGSKFLDCPCGIGRISIPLAKKGIKVSGADITKPYLEELAVKSKKAKLKIELKHCDMRRINYDSKFDAGGNLWTSFGYFEKESDNLLVIKKMYKALKPGGKFLLHVINRDWIMVNYNPRGWQRINDMKIVEERSFDYSKSINTGIWYFIEDGNERACETKIRMYSFHELNAMFKKVGFINIEGYGSIKDEPIDRHKMMMFVFGTKPKR
ncbi:MAG: methyltransferase domain-containing protein [candidate division Zixibacteria bacterium]|nr:methyltransferase domain-containing protein [candidate division Zixibacteria bacterium]